MGRSYRVNNVGTRVTFDDNPHPATLNMLPGFELHAIEIVPLENRFDPFRLRRIQRGVFDRPIAAIAEFAVVSNTAEGAGDSEHSELSVQFRVGTRAALIDIDAASKSIQGMVGDHRIRPVVGNEVGEIPS